MRIPETYIRAVVDATIFATMLGLLGMLLAVLAGCGSTTDRQAKTTERVVYTLPALVFDTPAGPVTTQPAKVQVDRQELSESTEQKKIDMPDPTPLIQAVASTTPWGGILAGVVGAVTTAAAGYKALSGAAQTKRMVKAQSEYADDLERAETDADVAAVKAKHADRQKTLGIHADLQRARHA